MRLNRRPRPSVNRLVAAVKSSWTWVWAFCKAAQIMYGKWRLERDYRQHSRWIDPNAKCPACGARSGKIHWEPNVKFGDGKTGAVVHTCNIDGARWGEKPIITSREWDIPLPPPEGDTAPFIHRPAAQPITAVPINVERSA
jgi:hypothetical protein